MWLSLRVAGRHSSGKNLFLAAGKRCPSGMSNNNKSNASQKADSPGELMR